MHRSRFGGLIIDCNVDDLEAEVRQLEVLGARRVEQVKSWWVMEAPTSRKFCIVPPMSSHFEETANRWD